uniref:CCDC66 domain-containing protein n=1 Tax=Macrostomum lignano TaxID=282301 RepID=A0A1I8FEF6_9PLAT
MRPAGDSWTRPDDWSISSCRLELSLPPLGASAATLRQTTGQVSGAIGQRDSAASRQRKRRERNAEYNDYLKRKEADGRSRQQQPQPAAQSQYRQPIRAASQPQPQAPPASDPTLDELERQVTQLRQPQGPYNGGAPQRPALEAAPPPAPPEQLDPLALPEPPAPAASQRTSGRRTPPCHSWTIGERAAAQKRAERNREYNEFLRGKLDQEATHRDWRRGGTGVHTRTYVDNPDDQYAAYNRPRPVAVKDPATLAEEKRLSELEAQYDSAKLRLLFGGGGAGGRRRNDDAWLRSGGNTDKSLDLDLSLRRNRHFQQRGRRGQRRSRLNRPDSGTVRENRKESYKRELQRQMAEEENRRKQERRDARSDAPGVLGGAVTDRPGGAGAGAGSGATSPGLLAAQSGGLPQLSPYNTPADDSYFYYGMQNPLEDGSGSGFSGRGGGGYVGGGAGAGGSGGSGPAKSSRVRYQENNDGTASTGMLFTSEEERRAKVEYALELNQQMDAKRTRDEGRRKERDEYDRLKELEIATYDPWAAAVAERRSKTNRATPGPTCGAPYAAEGGGSDGQTTRSRGGGDYGDYGGSGAASTGDPLKDLRLRLANSFTEEQGRRGGGGGGATGRARSRTQEPLPWIEKPTPRQTNALGEATHARGGHGIFGQGLTDAQKRERERYQDELRNQMEERRRLRELDQLRQREEDEREQRRVEEQQRRIQAELDAEKRKQTEKEEEARRKNEEMLRLAEEKRRSSEAARKAKEADRERVERAADVAMTEQQRSRSPPVPSLRGAPASAAEEADTQREEPPTDSESIVQLARLRNQLRSERQRVEDALETQKYQPEVFDPRLHGFEGPGDHRPVQGPAVGQQVDVFDMARDRRKAAPVSRRPNNYQQQSSLDPTAAQEFNRLKANSSDPAANQVRNYFPETPISGEALEAQQAALLREQRDRLRRMQGGGGGGGGGGDDLDGLGLRPATSGCGPTLGPTLPSCRRTPLSLTSISRCQLAAWIRTAISSDSRRGGGGGFGSQASLDAERIARANEARLRRLQRMQADSASLEGASGDPDEVLGRFMRQQRGLEDSRRGLATLCRTTA